VTLARPELLREIREDVHLFDGKTIYDAEGCDMCGKTGFKGRGAIFEVLQMTEAIQTLVIARRSSSEIKDKAIAEGMTTLRQDGWNRDNNGFTTIDEVVRVTEDQAE